MYLHNKIYKCECLISNTHDIKLCTPTTSHRVEYGVV